MSSSDKTKNKLLDSMRMSKTGVSETPQTDSGAAKKAETKAAPKKKPAAKKAAKKKPVNKPTSAKKAAARSAVSASDPFQSVGRIWPD